MGDVVKWGIIGLGNVAHEFANSFYNTKKVLEAYDYAIENNYKFFSYGDSTLII